jgi:hypothetical protein
MSEENVARFLELAETFHRGAAVEALDFMSPDSVSASLRYAIWVTASRGSECFR